MKKALLILALPLLQCAASYAFADDTVTPPAAKTRSQVKAEATAAARAGDTVQPDSAALAADKKAPVGDKTRKQVKDETRVSAQAGMLPKDGEAAAAQAADKKASGTKTRKQVKEAMKMPDGKAMPTSEMPAGMK